MMLSCLAILLRTNFWDGQMYPNLFYFDRRPHPDWPELKYDNEAYWIVDEVPSTGLDFPSKWVGPGYEAARPPV